MTACSTRELSISSLSRLEILLDGDTSSSEINVIGFNKHIWSDEGCDAGRMRVDDSGCTAKGTGVWRGREVPF